MAGGLGGEGGSVTRSFAGPARGVCSTVSGRGAGGGGASTGGRLAGGGLLARGSMDSAITSASASVTSAQVSASTCRVPAGRSTSRIVTRPDAGGPASTLTSNMRAFSPGHATRARVVRARMRATKSASEGQPSLAWYASRIGSSSGPAPASTPAATVAATTPAQSETREARLPVRGTDVVYARRRATRGDGSLAGTATGRPSCPSSQRDRGSAGRAWCAGRG